MGTYKRKDSRFWWMLLERPGQKPILESTKIPHDAPTAMTRKLQRQRAEEAYHARMHQLAGQRYELPTETETIRFSEYADWYDTHHTAKRRGATRERELLKALRGYFGSADLSEITRPKVQEYITHRLAQPIARTTRKVSPSTVNREIDLLKAMLREAVPRYLKANPLAGMKRLRTVKPKKRILTAAEERKLLAQLSPADQALYLVAVDTLIRLSNVLNLRRDEWKGGHLELTDSKTGPYTVPLSTRARAALEALPDTGPYLFAHRRTAKNPRDWRSSVRLMLQRACTRARIPYGRAAAGITFHVATRATGATRLLRSGVDLRTVQEIGHWADLRSIQEYLQPDHRRLRSAVNRIGADVGTVEPRPEKRRPSVIGRRQNPSERARTRETE